MVRVIGVLGVDLDSTGSISSQPRSFSACDQFGSHHQAGAGLRRFESQSTLPKQPWLAVRRGLNRWMSSHACRQSESLNAWNESGNGSHKAPSQPMTDDDRPYISAEMALPPCLNESRAPCLDGTQAWGNSWLAIITLSSRSYAHLHRAGPALGEGLGACQAANGV